MRLYDFSIYAQRRAEKQAALAVVDVATHIDKPGSVIELKDKVIKWMDLHKVVLKQTGSY